MARGLLRQSHVSGTEGPTGVRQPHPWRRHLGTGDGWQRTGAGGRPVGQPGRLESGVEWPRRAGTKPISVASCQPGLRWLFGAHPLARGKPLANSVALAFPLRLAQSVSLAQSDTLAESVTLALPVAFAVTL